MNEPLLKKTQEVTPQAEPANTGPAPAARRVMRHLLRGILAGDYAPGSRIREVELATQLGVSRGPVREALRTFARDGLLEIATWRGARVIDPTPREVANQLDLLGSTYGMVARFAVRFASDEALDTFSEYLREFETKALEGRERIELVEVSYRMAAHLGAHCGSTLAEEMLRKVGRVCYLQHRHLDTQSKRWLQKTLNRMHRLDRALHERSEDRAEKAARRLLENTADLVLARLKSNSTPQERDL